MNSEHKERDLGEKLQIATGEKAEIKAQAAAGQTRGWGMNSEHKERDYLPFLCFQKQATKVGKLEQVKLQLSAGHYSELKKLSPFFKEQSNNSDKCDEIEIKLQEVDVRVAVNYFLTVANPETPFHFSSWNKEYFSLSINWQILDSTDQLVQAAKRQVDRILEREVVVMHPSTIHITNAKHLNETIVNGKYDLVRVINNSPVYKSKGGSVFLLYLLNRWNVTNEAHTVIYAHSSSTTPEISSIEVMKSPLLCQYPWSEKIGVHPVGRSMHMATNMDLTLTAPVAPESSDAELLWEIVGQLHRYMPGYEDVVDRVRQEMSRRKDLWVADVMSKHLSKDLLADLFLHYMRHF